MKKVLKIISIFFAALLVLAVGGAAYLFYPHQPENRCVAYQIDSNSDFMSFIDANGEERKRENAAKRGLTVGGTWRDMENHYNIFADARAVNVAENPSAYFCEALHVISSHDYDQSQKMFTVLMMKRSAIHQYIALMKAGNDAYEQGVLTDKGVLMELLRTDSHSYSTAATYSFLPAWREQFNRHASELFDKDGMERMLNGKTAWGWGDLL